MDADQFLLPHLGPLARILLGRIVASGAAGVDGRDTDHWVLSRLIELRYVEALDDTAFVCTPAGRHRWQIEIEADEERDAIARRRQLIRQRLDERFRRLGIDTPTALTTAYSPAEPRLHCSMPALWSTPPQTKMRWSSALATLFAAAAAALVMILANTQPQEVRDWLFPPTPDAAAVPADQPKANVEQTVLVTAPAAALAAPVDLRTQEAPGYRVDSADAAPATTQGAAPIDTAAPSQKKGDDGTHQAELNVSVPGGAFALIDEAGREGSAVVDAVPPDGGAILNSALTAAALIDAALSESGHIATDLTTGVEHDFRSTAAALIDSAVSEGGQIATDVTTGVERSFRSTAAALLYALADIRRTVSAPDAVTQQVRDDVPAPVTSATEPPSQREQPATLQPALTSHTEAARATVPVTTGERVTAKGQAARGREANVDPQHAIVERLNKLSLDAARREEAWRPAGRGRPR